ncbi:MAG: methyltransferase domain-containing protein [Propionibacteriaceae bacterium]
MSEARDVYSHGHHDSVLRSHRWRTAENSAGYLLPHLRAGDQLLDIGSGPGTITLDLASRLSAGRVVGIDNAAEAVAAAREQAASTGADRVEFAIGDVYALDFADDTFDVVHAHQVLQHLSDPVAALREMRRVCRPGGLVAARDADYAAMTWHPEEPGVTRWLDLYRRVARSNSGEPDAGRRMRSWAQQAGFSEINATASAWCFADDVDVAWWSDSWADRVTQSSFARQAVERGLATVTELDELAAAWRTWGTAPDAWFSILHGEILATA